MSIDVECVATGTKHNDRAVAQIALVDQARSPVSAAIPCQHTVLTHDSACCLVLRSPSLLQFETPILNLYIKPEAPVVSYLTPLTGLTADLLEQHGTSLAIALATLRQALPKTAVLVGQNVRTDVVWLGLQERVDFAGMMDLAGLFRVFNPQYNSWSVFGQDHLARVLLGIDNTGCVCARPHSCSQSSHAAASSAMTWAGRRTTR